MDHNSQTRYNLSSLSMSLQVDEANKMNDLVHKNHIFPSFIRFRKFSSLQ